METQGQRVDNLSTQVTRLHSHLSKQPRGKRTRRKCDTRFDLDIKTATLDLQEESWRACLHIYSAAYTSGCSIVRGGGNELP